MQNSRRLNLLNTCMMTLEADKHRLFSKVVQCELKPSEFSKQKIDVHLGTLKSYTDYNIHDLKDYFINRSVARNK